MKNTVISHYSIHPPPIITMPTSAMRDNGMTMTPIPSHPIQSYPQLIHARLLAVVYDVAG